MFIPERRAHDENCEPVAAAANRKSRATDLNDEMRPELAALLSNAASGGMSSADFYDRLMGIHIRLLGEGANAPANETRRVKALRAFDGLVREAPSRHHELELLADALGIAPD
jgi:hypothetical protein